jgi:hypothetical protein
MAIVAGSGFTPSPGLKTCTQLQSEVVRFVRAPNSATALTVALDALREGVADINRRVWHWTRVTQDITPSEGDDAYDLSDNFKAPNHAHLLNADGNRVGFLGYIDSKNFLIENYDNSVDGAAYYYTVINGHATGEMTLSKAPDAAFVSAYPTIRLYYYRNVQPCAAGGDVLAVPMNVERYIAWRAKEYVAAVYDPDREGLARRRADKIWYSMVRDDSVIEATDWPENFA